MKKIEVKEEDYLEALIKKQERAYEIAKMKEQQEEFIKYLENEIYSFELRGTSPEYNFENVLKRILLKYKEIIGVLENDNYR